MTRGEVSRKDDDGASQPILNGSTPVSPRGKKAPAAGKSPRIISKQGVCNISQKNLSRKHRQYLTDWFSTLLDIKWRYILLMCVSGYFGSWVLFSVLWYVIGYAHADFEPQNVADEDWKPCVLNVYDYPTALLFSIETQHTIGYGGRQTSPHCAEAVVVMAAQSIVGVFITCFITGLAFAKLQRPKHRGQTVLFSERAVVCRRDGRRTLVFRVVNLRRSNLLEAQLRIVIVKKRVGKDGEVVPYIQEEVHIQEDFVPCPVLVTWPLEVEHHITAASPLYALGPADFSQDADGFEIHVILEGNVEATGMTAQVRYSYTPAEIMWGHQFAQLDAKMTDRGVLEVDYTTYHDTVPVDIHMRSAKDTDEEEALRGARAQSTETRNNPGKAEAPNCESQEATDDERTENRRNNLWRRHSSLEKQLNEQLKLNGNINNNSSKEHINESVL